MIALTDVRVHPPISRSLRSSAVLVGCVAFAALVGVIGASGCKSTPVTPGTTPYISLSAQRTVSEASSFLVSLQLDKASYAQGDSIKFALAIHNANGVHQTLNCGYTTTQRYDIIVRDSTAHTQIWRFAEDRTFDEVGGVIFDPAGGIADGDSVVFDEAWDQVGQHGAELVGGHLYSVTAFPICVSSRITKPSLTFTTRSGS